ncbi:carboxymuconolactone decarboxylase family protein [Thiospirillum jenense]|nr:carboxymuconolactone decarboxylase family protein [Thiospirillum jenense]
MSSRVFKDKIFPKHISDLMTLMHMMVFDGTDGEEQWETFLTLEEKECVALGLAQYYQCEHCIEHHTKALNRMRKVPEETLSRNMNSLVLFLRTDVSRVYESERQRWIQAWNEFALKVALNRSDRAMPHLIGLAIGMARDDAFLIDLCGREVRVIYEEQNIDSRLVIGELEALMIFMKAAASKNRLVPKMEHLFEESLAVDTH